jgi:hypothetical protein
MAVNARLVSKNAQTNHPPCLARPTAQTRRMGQLVSHLRKLLVYGSSPRRPHPCKCKSPTDTEGYNVNNERKTDDNTSLEDALESAFNLSNIALTEWPEQTGLSPRARAIQGQFLFVQARSAATLARDYWILRTQPDSLGFKVLARHIYENHISARYAALSPENTGRCLLYELEQMKKKLREQVIKSHEGFGALLVECNDQIDELKQVFGDDIQPSDWYARANGCGLGTTTYFYYRHLCEYAHAGYSAWRPLEASITDNSLDRELVNSVAGTAMLQHQWTNQSVRESFLVELQRLKALLENLP